MAGVGVKTRFEIWFPSDDRVSVLIETPDERSVAYQESLTVAAVVAGVIANLSKDVAESLCRQLADFSAPATEEEIPSMVGDLALFRPAKSAAEKGSRGQWI